jgi:hypothetical protein
MVFVVVPWALTEGEDNRLDSLNPMELFAQAMPLVLFRARAVVVIDGKWFG